jgi:predicted glutamine amidotransferase
MCGISGSNEFERAFTLYKLNLSRGSHSSGFMAISLENNDYLIDKVPEKFDQDWFESKKNVAHKFCYFLFHSRAPTNSVNTIWTTENTHPFKWKNYYVAHNGIISNFKHLEDNECFDVDSSIIPYHLFKNKGDLTKTYSNLQGLLTSWIFDSLSRQLFLAKAGSTLFRNNFSFSSTHFEDSEPIKEDGLILSYNKIDGFKPFTQFNYKNSYFIL